MVESCVWLVMAGRGCRLREQGQAEKAQGRRAAKREAEKPERGKEGWSHQENSDSDPQEVGSTATGHRNAR